MHWGNSVWRRAKDDMYVHLCGPQPHAKTQNITTLPRNPHKRRATSIDTQDTPANCLRQQFFGRDAEGEPPPPPSPAEASSSSSSHLFQHIRPAMPPNRNSQRKEEEPEEIKETPMDKLIQTFQNFEHPLVLVDRHAIAWSGANIAAFPNRLHLLVRQSELADICDELQESEGNEWAQIDRYDDLDYKMAAEEEEETGYCRVPRFVDLHEKILLTFWDETIYGLEVSDCLKWKVPDFYPNPNRMVLADRDFDPGKQTISILSEETINLAVSPPNLLSTQPVSLGNTKLYRPGGEESCSLFVPGIAQLMVAFGRQIESKDWSKDGIRSEQPHGPQCFRTVLIRDLGLKHLGQRRKLKSKIRDPVAWEEIESWLDTFPKVVEAKGVPIYEPRPKKQVKRVVRKSTGGRAKMPPRVKEVEEETQSQIQQDQPSHTGSSSTDRPEVPHLQPPRKEESRKPEVPPDTQTNSTTTPTMPPEPQSAPEPAPSDELHSELRPIAEQTENDETVAAPRRDEKVELLEQKEEEHQRQAWTAVNGRQTKIEEKTDSTTTDATTTEASSVAPPELRKRRGPGRPPKSKAEKEAAAKEREALGSKKRGRPAKDPKDPKEPAGAKRPGRKPRSTPAAAVPEEVPETPQETPMDETELIPNAVSSEVPEETQLSERVDAPQERKREIARSEVVSETGEAAARTHRKETVEASPVEGTEPIMAEDTSHRAINAAATNDSEALLLTVPASSLPEADYAQTQVPATQESCQRSDSPASQRDVSPEMQLEEEPDAVPNTSQPSPESIQRKPSPELSDVEMPDIDSKTDSKHSTKHRSQMSDVESPAPGPAESRSIEDAGSPPLPPALNPASSVASAANGTEKPEPVANTGEDTPVERFVTSGPGLVEYLSDSETEETQRELDDEPAARPDNVSEDYDQMDLDAASPETVRPETPEYLNTTAGDVSMLDSTKTPATLNPELKAPNAEIPKDLQSANALRRSTSPSKDVTKQEESDRIGATRPVTTEETTPDPQTEVTEGREQRQRSLVSADSPTVDPVPTEQDVAQKDISIVGTNKASEEDAVKQADTHEEVLTPPRVEILTATTLLQSSPELAEPTSEPITKKSKIVTLKYSGHNPPFTQSEAVIPQELAPLPAPVKRGRGRPPRNAQAIATIAEAKKRPGRRPRKQSEVPAQPESPVISGQVLTAPGDVSEIPAPSVRRGRGRGGRTQSNRTPGASPVKKRGRPFKSTELVHDEDSDDQDFAPVSKSISGGKTLSSQKPGRNRQTPSYEEPPDSLESELSSVESSDHDGDFVDEDDLVLTTKTRRKKPDLIRKDPTPPPALRPRARPLPGARSLRQRTQKTYAELAPSEEESEEEPIAPERPPPRLKISLASKPVERESESPRTSISPLRSPPPKPTADTSTAAVDVPEPRPSKSTLAKELFGSDSEADEEEEERQNGEQEKDDRSSVEKSVSPLRDVKSLLAMNNDDDEQEDEFRTAEDQHLSERHEEFFTPPEQQLLNEQAMHDSEDRHKTPTSDAMDTSEDHPSEKAGESPVPDSANGLQPKPKSPESAPDVVVDKVTVQAAPSTARLPSLPPKPGPVSLESNIPVASPEEIQEMAKVLNLELDKDAMMEKNAVDMDNTIRDVLDDQDEFEQLTQSISGGRNGETSGSINPHIGRLPSLSEVEDQATAAKQTADAHVEIPRSRSLFSSHQEDPFSSGGIRETIGSEDFKKGSNPVNGAPVPESRLEAEAHVDLEIRERFGVTKESSSLGHSGSRQIRQETSSVQTEADIPQGFPAHYGSESFDSGAAGNEGTLSGPEAIHLESRQEEHHTVEQEHGAEGNRAGHRELQESRPSESLGLDGGDVTLEPKEEDPEELQPQPWDPKINPSGEYFGMNHQPPPPTVQGIVPPVQPLESQSAAAQAPALHLAPMLSPVSETASQSIELPRILPQIQFSQPQNLPPGLPQQLMSSIHPAKRPRLGSKSKSHEREPSPVHAPAPAPPPTEAISQMSSRVPPPQHSPQNQPHSPSLVNGSFNTHSEPDWNSHTAREHRFMDQSPPFPSPSDVMRRPPVARHEDVTPRNRQITREERDRQVMGPPSRLPDRFGPQFNVTPTRQRLAAKLAARTAAAGSQQRTPKSAAPQRIGSLEIREVSSDRLEERLQRRLQERMREKMKNKRTKEEPPRKARQEQRLAETLRQRLEQDFDRGSREPSVARVTEPERRPLHVNRSRMFNRHDNDFGRFDQNEVFDDYSRDTRRQPFDHRPNAFVNRPANTHREETLRWTQEQRTRIREEIGHTPVNRNRPPVPDWTPESVAQPDFPDFDDRDEPPGKKMRYDYDPVHEDTYRTMAPASHEDSRIAQRFQDSQTSDYHTSQDQGTQQNQSSSAGQPTRDFRAMELSLPWPFPSIIVNRINLPSKGFRTTQSGSAQANAPDDDPDGEDEIDDADHHSLQSAQVVSPRDVYQQQPDEDSENSGEDDGTDYLSQPQNKYLQPPPAQPSTKRRRGRPRGSGKSQNPRVGQDPEYTNETGAAGRGAGSNRRGRPPGRPPGSGRGRGKAVKSAGEVHDVPPGQAYPQQRRASGQSSTGYPPADSQSYYNMPQSSQGSTRGSKENVDGGAPRKRGRPRKTFASKDEQAYYGNGAGRSSEGSRANGTHGDDPALS
ncbi:hypothetical protein BJ508DRAFT_303022 [Ascobolus immersus RN42]|uniref:Uncharacterized protein n=1 Tax=Ascobolus immersus RN42 TaxID=1160509 RepID=A0A3N4IIV3_ASCIM|nr:hypothetical protein BJ508DRAFT_303022 [Ascobolus immersus RN42]